MSAKSTGRSVCTGETTILYLAEWDSAAECLSTSMVTMCRIWFLPAEKKTGEARNGAEPMNKSGHGAAELPTWLLKVILPSKEPMIADTDVS